MRQTGNNKLIWHLSSTYGAEVHVLSTSRSNMTKLICLRIVDFYRISTRKSILLGKNENIQGKCILSACESVYREIFEPHRETLRLPSKP